VRLSAFWIPPPGAILPPVCRNNDGKLMLVSPSCGCVWHGGVAITHSCRVLKFLPTKQHATTYAQGAHTLLKVVLAHCLRLYPTSPHVPPRTTLGSLDIDFLVQIAVGVVYDIFPVWYVNGLDGFPTSFGDEGAGTMRSHCLYSALENGV
jgi:hypothetical protein